MNSIQLHDLFREFMTDQALPTLWSDTEIYSYMDAAQKMLARLTGGIPDSRSAACCTVTVTAGEAYSPLHASVLKVRYAQLDSTGRELDLYNIVAGKVVRINSDSYFDSYSTLLDDTQGPVVAAVLGMDEAQVRWVRVPTANDTVTLVVDRLPITTIAVPSPDPQTLEVREEHHYYLMYWMAHLAYLKPDSETYDRGRSDRMEADFRNYCGLASSEKDRRKHVPREVTYGGL